MLINGYYRDGDVVMLSCIVVKLMKRGMDLELGPVFGGTRVRPP
jgi:hypothetical protein